MMGLAADLARGFFIGSQVSNAAREGALFAAHHAATETSRTQFETDTKTVISQEEQSSTSCPSGSLSTTIAYSSTPTIPLPAGSSTTETITVSCTYTDYIGLRPDGGSQKVATTVNALLVN